MASSWTHTNSWLKRHIGGRSGLDGVCGTRPRHSMRRRVGHPMSAQLPAMPDSERVLPDGSHISPAGALQMHGALAPRQQCRTHSGATPATPLPACTGNRIQTI